MRRVVVNVDIGFVGKFVKSVIAIGETIAPASYAQGSKHRP